MQQKKLKGQTASIVEFVCGGILALAGFSGFSQISHSGASGFFMALAWLLLGLFLIACGIEWRLLIKSFKRYSGLVGNNSLFPISQLAQATSTSTKDVRSNLELMIKRGLAEGYVLDDAEGTVVNKGAGGHSPSQAAPTNAAAPTGAPVVPAQEKTTIICSGCGAKNEIVKGSTAECEHCGAKLSA